MRDEEIKEAIENCSNFIHPKALPGETIKGLFILTQLAELYLTIAGMEGMPEERKGYFVVGAQDSGHWVMTDEAEAYNFARQECILAMMKREQELKEGLLSVEEIAKIINSWIDNEETSRSISRAIFARLEKGVEK